MIQVQHYYIIRFYLKIMGALCNHKQLSLSNYKTQKKRLGSFSLEKIKVVNIANKKGSDCLLILVDTQCNISKNEYVVKLDKPKVASKLQQYFDLQLKGKCMNPGDCFLFDVSIEHFNYKCVAVLCINLWEGSGIVLQDPLQQDIQNSLECIKEKGWKNISIAEANAQFGFPEQMMTKYLARAINSKKDEFEQISIICLNQRSQNLMMTTLEKQKEKKIVDELKKSEVSQKSEYY